MILKFEKVLFLSCHVSTWLPKSADPDQNYLIVVFLRYSA